MSNVVAIKEDLWGDNQSTDCIQGVKPVNQPVYETTDGKKFALVAEANKHQEALNLVKDLSARHNMSGTTWRGHGVEYVSPDNASVQRFVRSLLKQLDNKGLLSYKITVDSL